MNKEKNCGIYEFIEQSNKYTETTLDGIDIQDIFNSALTGRVGNTNLFNNILNLLGREFKNTISTIRHCINNYYST